MKRGAKIEVGALVLLTWHDIHEDPSWREDGGTAHEVQVCESVGWVVRATRTVVTLTRTFGVHESERKAGDAISFPRGCIVDVETLQRGKKA